MFYRKNIVKFQGRVGDYAPLPHQWKIIYTIAVDVQ